MVDGDVYFDSWAVGKVQVPYGIPCTRLGSSTYTREENATTNTRRMSELPKPFASALNRGYVVDEEMGAI
jgi:hypothetical protein